MDKDELWAEALEMLLAGVEPEDPKHFFLPDLKTFGIFGDQFILVTSSERVETWVKKNYLNDIHAAIYAVSNVDYTINITTSNLGGGEQTQAPQPKEEPVVPMQPVFTPPQVEQASDQPDWKAAYERISPTVEMPPRQQLHQQQQNAAIHERNRAMTRSGNEALFSKCTFDSFVVGKSNEFARGAALAVAEQPGIAYNPLFIYGNSGLGKTHLLVAIANYISMNYPRMATCYVSANEFLNDYVEATQHNTWAPFNQKYHQVDVLLMDDVQYLEGKDETINQLFNIFNEMKNQNKQIVLSADRAPKDIDMDERMRSRFISGLLADIHPPDFETRLAIIKNSYSRAQQTTTFFGVIPDDVLSFLAEKPTSNIREMEGAIMRLIGNMQLCRKTDITIEEAKEVLQDFFPDVNTAEVTINAIQAEVERFFKISHEDMVSSKRSKELTYPRHIAIYLSRYLTNESLESIGKKFGGRDHTTIMYSVNKIEGDQKDNRVLYDQIQQLTLRIKENG